MLTAKVKIENFKEKMTKIWNFVLQMSYVPQNKAEIMYNLYSLRPKLLAKSWFMKQSCKIQHGLEDPKQATIHLALALQLKQDWGYPKGAKSSCSSKGFKVTAPQGFWWDFPLYKGRAKTLRCCKFEYPWATRPFSTFLDTPNLALVGGQEPSRWLLV